MEAIINFEIVYLRSCNRNENVRNVILSSVANTLRIVAVVTVMYLSMCSSAVLIFSQRGAEGCVPALNLFRMSEM